MLYFYSGNILTIFMIEIREYTCENGDNPFAKWLNRLNKLNKPAVARISALLTRIEQGNITSLKSLGEGVYESRLDWGPGYRIYLGREGKTLVILLGGGTKKMQQKDIERAKLLWQEYKRREKQERYGTDT